MAIISKLRPLIKPRKIFYQSNRFGGHGGGLDPEPTAFYEIAIYDKMHFYSALGLIPIMLFGAYMSIFYGDAILQETPEGYVPEDWECERNPIQKLLARYVLPDSVYAHEWKVGRIASEQDSRIVKSSIEQVKRVQLKYRDYRAWYFQPTEEAEEARADRYSRDKMLHYKDQQIIPGN